MPGRKKASESGDKRNIVTVPLTPKANRLINQWCEKMGGSKTATVQRLIEFWADAPESVRALMVKASPADLGDVVVARTVAYFRSAAMAGSEDTDTSAVVDDADAEFVSQGRSGRPPNP